MCSCSYAPDPDIGFSRFFRTEYLYYPKELHFTLFIARVNFNEEHPEEKLAFIYFFKPKSLDRPYYKTTTGQKN